MARRPQAGGAVLPPISKNEVGIYRCARARLMAFTLLLHKLKPQKERAAIGHVLLYSRQMPTTELRIDVILRLLVTFYHFPVTFYHFPPSFKNHDNDSGAVQIQIVAGKV